MVRRFWSMSLVDALDLARRKPDGRGDLRCRDAVDCGRRGTGPSCRRGARSRTPPGSAASRRCRWSAAAGGSRRARPARRPGVDLRLVQVRDRLEVRGAVAVLHEEALVVLEPVGRAGDSVVQPVGVVVLEHRPGALLEVGGRHELKVGLKRQAHRPLLAGRRLNGELRDVETLARRVSTAGRSCTRQPVAVLGDGHADGDVLPRVAAGSLRARVRCPRRWSRCRVAATSSLASSSDSPDEWRSGIIRPSTFSGPRARTHSAATVELSTPPERPTTAPRRLRVPRIWARIVREQSSATVAASMSRTAEENMVTMRRAPCGLRRPPGSWD